MLVQCYKINVYLCWAQELCSALSPDCFQHTRNCHSLYNQYLIISNIIKLLNVSTINFWWIPTCQNLLLFSASFHDGFQVFRSCHLSALSIPEILNISETVTTFTISDSIINIGNSVHLDTGNCLRFYCNFICPSKSSSP